MKAALAVARLTPTPWPRIPVDTSEGSDFHRLNRIAGHAMIWRAVHAALDAVGVPDKEGTDRG